VSTPSQRATAPIVADPNLAATTIIAVHRTRTDFDALRGDWDDLFQRAARGEHMFLSHAWLWHWANHYLDARADLAVVTVHRRGRLVLAWPLHLGRVAGLRELAFMGDPVSQYFDVLAEPAADLPELLETAWAQVMAATRPDIVRFVKVRADATLTPFLTAKGFRITATEEAPYARLSGFPDYAAFEARFPPKLRKNRRRQLRRLEERGPLAIRTDSGTPAAAAAVHTTMHLKRLWLQARGFVSRAFADRRFDAFFAAAAASSDRPAGVTVSTLQSNGEAVDMNICVTAKGRLGLHILAYDQRVEKLGAGNHHLELCLQRAFQDGLDVFDFLAPRHAYKMEWADGVVAVHDQAKALTWRGQAYLDVYVAHVREWAKAATRRLPREFMRRLSRWQTGGAKARPEGSQSAQNDR
jgi:CelD/BcsL family acetyltransferase involved in cellulose biosynthesis